MGVTVNNKFKTNEALYGTPSTESSSISSGIGSTIYTKVVYICSIVELSLLTLLFTSYVSYIYCPFANSNDIFHKFLQVFTAVFVGFECITKTYCIYVDLLSNSDTKSNSNGGKFDKYIPYIKLGIFMISFGLAITGLVPINLSTDENSKFSLTSLLISSGLAIFPFSLTDLILYSQEYNEINVNLIFTIIYAVGMLTGVGFYFKETNYLGVVSLGLLCVKGFEMACKLCRKIKNNWKIQTEIINMTVGERIKYWVSVVCGSLMVLFYMGVYVKKIDLAFPQIMSASVSQ